LPDNADEERADEVEADRASGGERWRALCGCVDLGLAIRRALTASDLIEKNFLTFGYAEDVVVAFSPPPSMSAGGEWDLNQVLIAAHANDDEDDVEDDTSKKIVSSDDGLLVGNRLVQF
jgi:hypothetical protein